jgi:hypothetical protein
MPMAAAAHEGLADIALHLAHARLPLPADGGGDAAMQPDDDTLTDQACSAIADPILSAACECSPRRPSPPPQACSAIAEHRAALRSLIEGISALRSVCRPGAAPARLLRLLAKLGRELTNLAHRYVLVRRPGRAVSGTFRSSSSFSRREAISSCSRAFSSSTSNDESIASTGGSSTSAPSLDAGTPARRSNSTSSARPPSIV